jgi:hemoglobin
MTIYAEIGGAPAVDAAVADFYERILADPSLVHFFDGIEMEQLMRHQRAFVTIALGGPSGYEGRDMVAAHAGLHITNEAFSQVVIHLTDTLEGLGVPDDTIVAIGRALIPYQYDVVTAGDLPPIAEARQRLAS